MTGPMSVFTVYWNEGKRELLQGISLRDALERAGYNWQTKGIFFWTVGDDHTYGWLNGGWVDKKKPVCDRCKDTHKVFDSRYEREIMCTSCPTPCQKCRAGGNGPYCEKTPCSCTCHKKTAGVELYFDLTIPAVLMHDFEEHVREMLSKFHPETNHADHHDCEFCGAWAGIRETINHQPECLGIKLQALIGRQP